MGGGWCFTQVSSPAAMNMSQSKYSCKKGKKEKKFVGGRHVSVV
jgi:hypothetical protein